MYMYVYVIHIHIRMCIHNANTHTYTPIFVIPSLHQNLPMVSHVHKEFSATAGGSQQLQFALELICYP